MRIYSSFEKTLNAFEAPLYLFEDWFNVYKGKNNSPCIHSYFYWDSLKEELSNISDLFFLCDTNIYMIQPFDVVELEKMNPFKLKEEHKCHSEDLIEIKFIDYDSEKELFSYSFQRGLYIKSNLIEFLKINQKYLYGKFVKVIFSYKVSPQGSQFLESFSEKILKLKKEEFNVFEKFVQNLFYQSKNIDNFKLPTDYEQENTFLINALKELTSASNVNNYKEEVFLLKEYFNKRNLEIFFIINKDFGKGYRIGIVDYTVLSHYMKNLVFKLIWKIK